MMNMKKYADGGPVPVPGKEPKEGGRKSRMRDMISPEERKELDAPLSVEDYRRPGMKKGGAVKRMAGGGCTRGDGVASRGKTKGRMV
jgi:hypothetical protein